MTGISTPPALGPVAYCTLIAVNGQLLVDAYTNYLHLQVSANGTLEEDAAAATGYPQLAGRDYWVLANSAGRQWLQVVEFPDAVPRKALASHGWMAMEILAENVDELSDNLAVSPFELLRPPADLDVSDQIRAFQARGPAGEVLYLTQVRGEVPSFDLPTCRAPVDHLFIPVLSTPDRDKSLADYSTISGNQGMCFDTRITVVNQALEFEMDRRHPVATLQLAGQALIEIDQIEGSVKPPAGVCAGLASIAFHCGGERPEDALALISGPFAGYHADARAGSAGERFTLIYT